MLLVFLLHVPHNPSMLLLFLFHILNMPLVTRNRLKRQSKNKKHLERPQVEIKVTIKPYEAPVQLESMV